MKSKLLYEKKILLRLDVATYDMVMAIAKKETKPNISQTIRELLKKVIHS